MSFQQHAHILSRIETVSEMATTMNPKYVTRFVESHMTENDGVEWKDMSKVQKNVFI